MTRNGIPRDPYSLRYRVGRWYRGLARKVKAGLAVIIIAIASLVGVTYWPNVSTPSASGDLNVTDQGSYRQVDLVDELGNQIRFTFEENFGEYNGNGEFRFAENNAQYSYNATNSTTDEVCSRINLQLRGVSWSDIADSNMRVFESSDELYSIAWDLVWNSSAWNVSGTIWLTYVNRLGWNPIGVELSSDEGGDSSVDLFVEMEADGGIYTGNADLYTVHNTAYLQCEDPSIGDPGQALVRWYDITSSGNWQDDYTWDNYAAQTRYQKAYKCDNDNVATTETAFLLFYKVIAGYTNWDLAKQFDAQSTDYTLKSSNANTGTWNGMNKRFGFYEVAADTRVANVTFDGAASTTYTPMLMVTGLSGNSTYYDVKNGSTTMTMGTDYWAHWNGTNGVLYLWFQEMNDAAQSFQIEEHAAAGSSPTVNSPADQEWVAGTTSHTIAWTVTDADTASGDYTVYKNTSYFASGTWTNATNIALDIDALTAGVWNMTIDASDGSANVTDTVIITVKHGVTDWIEDRQLSTYGWGPENITYDVLNDEWFSMDQNSYSTAYAVAALKNLSSSDIEDQASVISLIQGWQGGGGNFDSGLQPWYRFWEQYWSTWALGEMGSTPSSTANLKTWLNNEQTLETNEAYWTLTTSEDSYTGTEDRFSQTFAATMAYFEAGLSTSDISNWAEVKAWFDNRQNSDGGWDATNASESNDVPRSGYTYGNRSLIPYSWMACEVYNAAGENIPNNSTLATWVKDVQSDDGGWGYWSGDNSTNIWCTYGALRILDLLGESSHDDSGAETYLKSCQGSNGFSWRPELLDILEATYYGVKGLEMLSVSVPNSGSDTAWEPDTPSGNIYMWQTETFGTTHADDPPGAIAKTYSEWGLDLIAPKQASSGDVTEAQTYSDNHNLGLEVCRSYEDYGANPWLTGIPDKWDHAHEWMVDTGSPSGGQDYELATHVTSLVDDVKSAGGVGGFYMPSNYIDAVLMDLNHGTDIFETGYFSMMAGHYWQDAWKDGSNAGIGPVMERWANNRTWLPNADAHVSTWHGGQSHAYQFRGFFVAPNNTIEGLLYAIEKGWTAIARADKGSSYPVQYYDWDPTYVRMWGYSNVVEWIDDNQTDWQWWDADAGNPITNIVVFPISNGSKNSDDYSHKSSDENSNWNSARDGALFRIYFHEDGGTSECTINWVSIGNEQWTNNISPTVYDADWSADNSEYADYKWFEYTDLPMGRWNVTIGYTMYGDGAQTYTTTVDIGAIPHPYIYVENAANRTIANNMVIDLAVDVSDKSSIDSVYYGWDGDADTLLADPYEVTVTGLSNGGHYLTVTARDTNYTVTRTFYYTVATSPTTSGIWAGNKSVWDNDKMSRWYDIAPWFPPSDGNLTVYALLQGQTAPTLCFEKRYAQYTTAFETSSVALTSKGTYDSYFTLWQANITEIAPGMNVTYWVMYDDTTNSTEEWLKAGPDPFQTYYGIGLLSSWGEDDWSVDTALTKMDEVSATLLIPINTWGQTSTERYYTPFANSSDLYEAEDGSWYSAGQDLEEWLAELDAHDPNRTRYKLTWFFYHNTFRDEAPLEVAGPRTEAEWNVLIDKYQAIIAGDTSFIGFVLDQEYANYHDIEDLWRLYDEWDDDQDGTLDEDEEEEHIVQTFLDSWRAFRWVEYGGQPHLTYRWSSHTIPSRAYVRASVNHFQHADEDGGDAEFFRQIDYAVATTTGNVFSPGLLTMGVSPCADDLAMDYWLHNSSETHNTATTWDDFGFADQVLYAALLNPMYITLWVHSDWDSGSEPYDFDDDEKTFAKGVADLLNTVPYVGNLTYTLRPSASNLSVMGNSTLGTKPAWLTTNASDDDGVYYSVMKETGSMYQIVAINLWPNLTKTLNVTIGSGLFTEYDSVSKLVAFNASDCSDWANLNDTDGERSFTIEMSNSSIQVFKVGVPFEVLGLPFDYDGYNWTSGMSTYPDSSAMTVVSFDWDTLSINVTSNISNFFKFYLSEEGASYTLTINGVSFNSTNTIATDIDTARLGLVSGEGSAAESENTDPEVNSPADQEWAWGTSPHTIGWIVTDAEDGSGDYTVYRNGSYHGHGTWTDTVSIDYNVASEAIGYWVFSIQATDGHGGTNATDTVNVNVTNTAPTITSPSDQEWVQGTSDHYANWTVTDTEHSTGSYTVYRNESYHGYGTWTNATEFSYNVTSLASGYWNITIDAEDGYLNVTDLVWVNVTVAGGGNYNFTESVNPSGTSSITFDIDWSSLPKNVTPTNQTAGTAIIKIVWDDRPSGAELDMNFSNFLPSNWIIWADPDGTFDDGDTVEWTAIEETTAKEILPSGGSSTEYIWLKLYVADKEVPTTAFTVYFQSRSAD